ncbi:MAG: MazG nucleotide pyrophosphohydrolase domain-containing protein [Nitrososphaerota archaeon]
MNIAYAQKLIDEIYGGRDRARGLDKTALWLVSEMGEVADSLVKNDLESLREEVSDVLAWLLTLCNVSGIDLETEFKRKYGNGCPRCRNVPCRCP